MVYFFYDVLIFLAALIYLPFYAMRGRLHRDILMRLGIFRKDYFKNIRDKEGREVVWIHAVSVGEARAAESLIRIIRQEWPARRIVVSTVTPTGQKIAQRILNDREVVFYAPLDISFAVERFLREISPKVLIIMETEIWPNLIRLAKKRGCCVVVANGRISESSFRGYRRLGPFLRPIVQMVDLFCMQTDESEERIKTLGAPAAQVKRTGNIKFDISADWKESSGVAHFKKLLGDSLLLVAGSTHENEEEMLIAIYKSLHKDFKELRLLIAPRHVERVAKIRHSVRLAGFETSYFSTLKSFGSAQVVLLDTIGDLNALYRFCAIAFVGGSLVKKGGHNLIEPALFGKPIIFGKHMDNFAEIRDLFIKEKSAIEVDSPEKLEYELRRLIANSDERRALGARSRELLEKHKGAAVRTFAEIKKVAA